MLQNVKGTADFYPDEMAVREWVFDKWKNIAKRYSYQLVESPAIETLELLTAKEGEEIVGQIFTLEQRGSEKLGLRFDLTVPMARMFALRQKELKLPVKWLNISRMWRYEQPQAGRLREFYQMSVETFGSDRCDAQILMFAIDSLTCLGLTSKDFKVRINSRKLLEGLMLDFTDKVDDAIKIIDRCKKISDDVFAKELEAIGVKSAENVKHVISLNSLADIERLNLNATAKAGLVEIKNIFSELPAEYRDCIVIDLSVARGLSYYTGFVFEIFDSCQKYRALAGGGRYDNMVRLFGGEAAPACGFGMGYSTVLLLLQDKGLMPEIKQAADYYVAPVSEDVRLAANEICARLRKKGFAVDIDIMGRKLAKQLEYASAVGAKKAVIVGKKDLEKQMVTVRDMQAGSEEKVEINRV